MSDFKSRLLEERGALDEKIMKLDDFIISDKFKGLEPTQQHLLKVQLPIMQAYSQVLRERITLL